MVQEIDALFKALKKTGPVISDTKCPETLSFFEARLDDDTLEQ